MLKNHRTSSYIAIIFTLFVISSSAYSQRLGGRLSGAQETPPNGSPGFGYGHVILSPDQTQITVDMGFTGLGTAATAAHIHTAPIGVAGPVTFGLSGVPGATSGVIPQQTFAISPAQLADLLAGNMYFNIHTGGFPGGEIRGQILPAACDTASAIEVQATAGTMVPTGYTELNLAFAAINAGTHQGAIDVEVCGNTTETASAALNSGAVAPAAYTSVNVYPVGAARTVTGSIVGAIVKLNGADNVTIDGRLSGTGRNLTVSNTNTSAATAAVWLASVVAGNGASNNVVRNLELAAGATQNTSTNSTFGIIMCGTTISTTANGVDNDNDAFIANRIIRARYGIVTRGSTTDLNVNPVVTDNIVGPSAFGADQIGKVGIFMQADQGALVSRNTVQFVGGDFANTTGGADRVGIGIGQESWSMSPGTLTSNTYTVTRNMVHDVVEERTFSSVGLLLATTGGGSATNNLVANNFIYNVKANSTGGDQTVGLGISGGHTDTVSNNSISLTGEVRPNAAATATTMFGSGIRVANTNGTTHLNLTLTNNSVYMDLTAAASGTVRYYAISGNVNTYSFGTGSENFNNYYVNPANTQLQTGGLGSVSGVTLTTQFATLANWQTAYTAPQDANSIQANPNHLSPTADLHITGASPNVNVGTTIAAVSVDIDNEARPNGVAYDIGADEFYPSPGVLQLSSATYGGNEGASVTVTINRVSGSTGTVGATLTLADGSATGGAACTAGIDYINPGPQLVSFGDTVTSQNVGVTLCADAPLTDPAETFTVTLSAATGGATLGTPIVATVTITDVPAPFSGSYTVGSGGNYPSLTNPGGIFEAMNLAGVSGTTTINITADLTGETGAIALNDFNGPPLHENLGGATVTIKPSGAPRSITGATTGNTGLIRVNGADNVTIDGSLSGGTDRSLTIQNTNSTTAHAVIQFASLGAGAGANSNTVKNTILRGGTDTSVSTLITYGISNGGAVAGSVGADNDNVVFRNNDIAKVAVGIYSAGETGANQNQNTTIEGNLVGPAAFGSEQVWLAGIIVPNTNIASIVGNEVRFVGVLEPQAHSGGLIDKLGISAGFNIGSDTSTAAVALTNARVTGNRIHDIVEENTFSAVGIGVAGGNGAAVTGNIVANNMIYNVRANGTAGDTSAGIMITSGSGDVVAYNSIYNTGDLDPGAATTASVSSYGIQVTSTTPTNLTLLDNISYVDHTSNTGTLLHGAIRIPAAFAWGTGSANNNDYFVLPANTQSVVGRVGATTHATLAAYQAAVTPQEVNSLSIDPAFVSATDLHLQVASPMLGVALPVAGINNDFDNDLRDSLPDIGADEVVTGGRTGTIPAGTYRDANLGTGTLAGNVTLTGNLILSGLVDAGANTLSLGCSSVVTGAGPTNYVVGTVSKDFCNTGSFTFPVGTTPDGMLTDGKSDDKGFGSVSEYTPVTANITALGTVPSSLSARAFDNTLSPFDPMQSLSRNWDLRETGDLTADLTFKYLPGTLPPGDVNGTESNYRVWRRSSGGALTNLCPLMACVDTMNSTIGPVTGVMQFSRWTGAGPAVPTASVVSISGRVTTADGAGIRNASVVVTGNTLIQPLVTQTASFGYYTIEGLRAGETYVVTINSRRFTFQVPVRVVTVNDSMSDIDFMADPQQ